MKEVERKEAHQAKNTKQLEREQKRKERKEEKRERGDEGKKLRRKQGTRETWLDDQTIEDLFTGILISDDAAKELSDDVLCPKCGLMRVHLDHESAQHNHYEHHSFMMAL